MASRRIEDLDPKLQPLCREFLRRCEEANIPVYLTCTRRSQEEQEELYAQGRTKAGAIVTWTLKSLHIDGLAFDFVIIKDKKPCWDLKADVNDNDIPDYLEAGRIAEEVGLEWGGSWKKTKDYPHCQIRS